MDKTEILGFAGCLGGALVGLGGLYVEMGAWEASLWVSLILVAVTNVCAPRNRRQDT